MNDKSYEKIGKTIAVISYIIFAIKFIAIASAVSAVFLYIFDKPLYFAPIIGLVIFLVYRFVRRTVFKILYKLSRL